MIHVGKIKVRLLFELHNLCVTLRCMRSIVLRSNPASLLQSTPGSAWMFTLYFWPCGVEVVEGFVTNTLVFRPQA